jgi:hypothetical protein
MFITKLYGRCYVNITLQNKMHVVFNTVSLRDIFIGRTHV